MTAPLPIVGRAERMMLVKAALAVLVLSIMLLTFRHPLPLAVATLDLAIILPYLWAVRRWPVTATYLLLAETTLALTPRQFVQGYVNGINWVLYIPLPLAAGFILGRSAVLKSTALVTAIALPMMLIAALTLPAQVSTPEILTLVAYLLLVVWAVSWLNSAEDSD